MFKSTKLLTLSTAILVALAAASAKAQLSTAFTYQGVLTDNGVPVTTAVDIRCTVFDAATFGNQVGSPVTSLGVVPVAGQFALNLDFGQFTNANRWLQIEYKPAGGPTYTVLSPRQRITSTPFANYSIQANSAATLNGQLPSFYTNAANISSGILADTRLSTNVPLLNANSVHTGRPSFNGGATGVSAPFLVDSTFKVTDLNADLLDGLDSAAFSLSSHAHAHSSLTGLTNDDHTQYYNQARGDARYARLATTPAFSGVDISSGSQSVLNATSTFTGGSWLNLGNTSTNARTWNLISTGSSNSEGAGKLLFRDASAGSIRMAIDTAGRVGIGTASPGAPFDVFVAGGQSLQFRQDGGIPGMNVNTTGGVAGIMRLRNAMEVWPSDDGARGAKLDVRNTNGSATITLEGASGNIAANNLAAARSVQTIRESRQSVFPGNWVTVGQGGFANLETMSVTIPANGTLMITATANAFSRHHIYFKLEEITGATVQLIEQQFDFNPNGSLDVVSAKNVCSMTWSVATGPGRRTFRTVMTNGDSSSDAYVGTTTLHVMYFPNTLAP